MNCDIKALVPYTSSNKSKRNENSVTLQNSIYNGRIYQMFMGSSQRITEDAFLALRLLSPIDRYVLKAAHICRADPLSPEFSNTTTDIRLSFTSCLNLPEINNSKQNMKEYFETVLECMREQKRKYLRKSLCASEDEVQHKKSMLEIYRQAAWESDRPANIQRKIDRDIAIYELCPFVKKQKEGYHIIRNYWSAVGTADWPNLSEALQDEYSEIYHLLNNQLHDRASSIMQKYLSGKVSFYNLRKKFLEIETNRRLAAEELYYKCDAFERCALEYHFFQSAIMYSHLLMKFMRAYEEQFQKLLVRPDLSADKIMRMQLFIAQVPAETDFEILYEVLLSKKIKNMENGSVNMQNEVVLDDPLLALDLSSLENPIDFFYECFEKEDHETIKMFRPSNSSDDVSFGSDNENISNE